MYLKSFSKNFEKSSQNFQSSKILYELFSFFFQFLLLLNSQSIPCLIHSIKEPGIITQRKKLLCYVLLDTKLKEKNPKNMYFTCTKKNARECSKYFFPHNIFLAFTIRHILKTHELSGYAPDLYCVTLYSSLQQINLVLTRNTIIVSLLCCLEIFI